MASEDLNVASILTGGLPALSLGTYLVKDEEVAPVVEAALRLGYRAVDTAQGYHNEGGVGRGLRASGVPREDVFITTKLWPGNEKWGDPIADFAATIAACEASLAALGVDAVDLYLIHAPFAFEKSLEAGLDQWKAMLELKRLGKAKLVGVSNYGLHHLQAIEAAGLALPDANQLELHPVCQHRDLVAWCRAKGVAITAYSSLAPLSTWRVKDDGGRQNSGKAEDVGGGVAARIAATHSMSEAQVLLRWALEKGYAILPKSTKEDRLKSNIDVFGADRKLTPEDMAALDALNAGGDRALAWPVGDPSQTPIA